MHGIGLKLQAGIVLSLPVHATKHRSAYLQLRNLIFGPIDSLPVENVGLDRRDRFFTNVALVFCIAAFLLRIYPTCVYVYEVSRQALIMME